MSDDIGTYSFLPYLRQGLGNKVQAPTNPAIKRGQIAVTLTVDGQGLEDPAAQNVTKKVEIYGPGDVVGIERKAIIKTEPRDYITNFEPNYLPYIDFYDEDFLWRYTPNKASNDRLIPWLTLVVLEEKEFKDGPNILNKPLNYIDITNGVSPDSIFPPIEDLWAWGHVHVNRNIVGAGVDPVSSDQAAFISEFKKTLSQDPDLAYSRLVSPRKLGENVGYHAFLIPSFEAGRLAGLGQNPDEINGFNANTIAWETYGAKFEPQSFPYYYRWYFRTSSKGDFEYLVRLLQPRVADSRVGHRDMDVLYPGSGIKGIEDERLKGILRLGGALQVPLACLDAEQAKEYKNYDEWFDSYPHRYQKQMAAFINLSDQYVKDTAQTAHQQAVDNTQLDIDSDDDPDPLVTPPLYGRWHSLTPRLLVEKDATTPVKNNQNWVHELNLDPRWRTAANFGTEIIQEKQEEYMDAAWGQVGDVIEANRRLNWSVLATLVARVWYQRHFVIKPNIAAEKYLSLTTPVQKRIIASNKTVYYNVNQSFVPKALISPTMRRIIRPRGRLVKRIEFDSQVRTDNLIDRVNREEVTPAPIPKVPDELLTHSEVTEAVYPAGTPNFLLKLLSRYPWIQYIPLVLGLLIILFLFLTGIGGMTAIVSVAAVAIGLYVYIRRLTRQVQQSESILPEQQTPAAVDILPTSPDFRITEPGDPFVPAAGASDSPEAVRFKKALKDNFDYIERSREAGKLPEYQRLDIPALARTISESLNPAVTIPRYTFGKVQIPSRLIDAMQNDFKAAMAYPEIDVPMYEPLSKLSDDHFVPNLRLIEQNSITLLETNQEFIEAYMVGLNHEFARELMWREYPTDQRGSYFRQFWDISSFLNKDNLNDEQLREKLRDIPEIHRWRSTSNLGDHDHREQPGEKENEVVLVIRGELLKKYPTAVIYAHRAKWKLDNDDKPILTEPRDFDDTAPESEVIKMPLYEAKVDPDIYFFGFDLDVIEAKGDDGETANNPGWFFVIKERPGEPRFGFDVPGDSTDFTVNEVPLWNDLKWSHVVETPDPGAFISIHDTRSISVPDSSGTVDPDDEEKIAQIREDSHLVWSSEMNAAELAYILYQVPVLMGVHAAEMLPDKCENLVEG